MFRTLLSWAERQGLVASAEIRAAIAQADGQRGEALLTLSRLLLDRIKELIEGDITLWRSQLEAKGIPADALGNWQSWQRDYRGQWGLHGHGASVVLMLEQCDKTITLTLNQITPIETLVFDIEALPTELHHLYARYISYLSFSSYKNDGDLECCKQPWTEDIKFALRGCDDALLHHIIHADELDFDSYPMLIEIANAGADFGMDLTDYRESYEALAVLILYERHQQAAPPEGDLADEPLAILAALRQLPRHLARLPAARLLMALVEQWIHYAPSDANESLLDMDADHDNVYYLGEQVFTLLDGPYTNRARYSLQFIFDGHGGSECDCSWPVALNDSTLALLGRLALAEFQLCTLWHLF